MWTTPRPMLQSWLSTSMRPKPFLGTEKLAHYSLLAGERSLPGFAWEEALGHFSRGLAAKGEPSTGDRPASDVEAAELLTGLGRAQAATLPRNRIPEAITTLKRAFDYYANVGDLSQVVSIAEQYLPPMTGINTEMAQIVGRALELVPPDSVEAGRLWCSYTKWTGIEGGNHQESQGALDRALEIAHRVGDSGLEMTALTIGAQVEAFHLRLPDCLDKSLRAIELVPKADNLRNETVARFFVVFAFITMGHTDQVIPALAACLDSAQKLRDRYWLRIAYWGHEILFRLVGDWPMAREFSNRALADNVDARFLARRAMLEYQVGDFDQGESHLNRLWEITGTAASLDNTSPVSVVPSLTRISGSTEGLDIAESVAQNALASPDCTPFTANFAHCTLGLLAIEKNDAIAAAKQYAALEPYRGTIPMSGFIAIDRLLGLLSQTIGNLDQAATHFEDALAFCRKAGYQPELAWSCCDYADMLKERDAEGDRAKAMSLLDESLAISSELGMRPLMERVLSRREILKA